MARSAGRCGAAWRRAVAHVKATAPMVCILCGERIDPNLPARHPRSFSVDHKIPVGLGGHPTDPANLGPAHYGCNSRKGKRLKPPTARRTSRRW